MVGRCSSLESSMRPLRRRGRDRWPLAPVPWRAGAMPREDPPVTVEPGRRFWGAQRRRLPTHAPSAPRPCPRPSPRDPRGLARRLRFCCPAPGGGPGLEGARTWDRVRDRPGARAAAAGLVDRRPPSSGPGRSQGPIVGGRHDRRGRWPTTHRCRVVPRASPGGRHQHGDVRNGPANEHRLCAQAQVREQRALGGQVQIGARLRPAQERRAGAGDGRSRRSIRQGAPRGLRHGGPEPPPDSVRAQRLGEAGAPLERGRRGRRSRRAACSSSSAAIPTR